MAGEDSEFVIVGGGLLGLATAAALTRRGRQATRPALRSIIAARSASTSSSRSSSALTSAAERISAMP